MRITAKSLCLAFSVCALLGLFMASPALAQTSPGPPGQPQATVNADNTVTLTFTEPQTGGAVAWYLLRVIYNGANFPGSPFMLYYSTTVTGGPLPAGTYTVSAIAVNSWGQNEGFPTTFTIAGATAPGVPTLATPVVSASTVSFQWTPGGGAPAASYEISATVQATGQAINLPVGNQTYYVVNAVPPGSYVIRLRAWNAAGASPWTAPQTVVVGGMSLPGTPTLYQPTVSGSNVALRWDAPTSGGGQTSYDIEALIQSTGQTVTLSVDGSQTSVTVPGVPQGNFIVKMRARNVLGVGPWTAERIVVVGVALISGDLQVTLTWNTTVDMDLHVIEPNGTHVYYSRKTGTSANLDVDDRNGYGPENAYVSSGQALAGTYQFYVVQYGSMSTPTTSTIGVRLYPNTANERTAIFTRTTSAGNTSLGYNVADVNILAGTIAETTGTRTSGSDEREASDVKVAVEPPASQR